ncbi:hypothetical protein SAMN05428642_1021101 [Flaviramulus basaltis]|uniref:DUF5672 domain-containing protein n=1 Tax=Flaviramulus basaltis TaxID=369401 RepID=A0A1K2IMR3_9FLAO|nr:DUF5672 family protein [Flaviramulus basaltis]SFZ92963.1 hypothetical protein SAMN05428642_1021101 [Flaviramulus basaltis]
MGKYNKKVVIVIPIYNDCPSEFELISFRQCFKILDKHPIKIIAPHGLSMGKYQEVVSSFEVVYIDSKWQSSIEKYNKLKMSQFFYKFFDDYQYLLTYELDAFVFKDELLHWCNKGYDYIGSPWFLGYENPTNEFLGVGNSGFSLRNVRAMKRAIRKVYINEAAHFYFGKRNRVTFKLSTLLNYLLIYFGENDTIQRAAHTNEDAFIAQIIAKRIKDFKIAPIREAIQFGFEVKPKYLYQLNENRLPMGCHAWWKYDLKFWKPFIENFGYKINFT